MTLDVDGLRLHIVTGLDDEALTLKLAAAYEAIDEYLGTDTGSYSELLRQPSGDLLMLSRRASAITSITEGVNELAADDYELRASGQMVRRLYTGTYPANRWLGRVDVTYVPLADDNERDRVAIALVQLDLNFNPGLVAERVGDHAETYSAPQADVGYQQQRAQILSSLGQGAFLL